MNAIVRFRKCTLTDEKLIQKVDEMIDRLYDPNVAVSSVIVRRIPAQPNEDFDLLVGELIVRFAESIGYDAGFKSKKPQNGRSE